MPPAGLAAIRALGPAGFRRWYARLNNFDPDASGHRPFWLAGRSLGWLGPETAGFLLEHGHVVRREGGYALPPAADVDHAGRSGALYQAASALIGAGRMGGFRNEPYRVVGDWGGVELAVLDRRAIAQFGFRSFGIHVNGFCRLPDGLAMWLGRRALDREVEPGKRDNMVAGGQPAGLGLMENLIKEAAEEAGLSPEQAAMAVQVARLDYCQLDGPERVKRDTIFAYDLELPAAVEPRNTDGEVAAFERLPLAQVAAIVHGTDEFKPNCNLVVIDFLIRHGLLSADVMIG